MIAMVLMYTSRYFAKGERANRLMEVFMTLTYIVCCGKLAIVLHKFVCLHWNDCASLMTLDHSDGEDWRCGTSPRNSTTSNDTKRSQACDCKSNRMSVNDTVIETKRLVLVLPYLRADWTAVSNRHSRYVCAPSCNSNSPGPHALRKLSNVSKNWNPAEPGTCTIDGLAL
jgi:hypothetical protein